MHVGDGHPAGQDAGHGANRVVVLPAGLQSAPRIDAPGRTTLRPSVPQLEPHRDGSTVRQPLALKRDSRGGRGPARIVLAAPRHNQSRAPSRSQRATREQAATQNPATADDAATRRKSRNGVRRVNRTPFTAAGSAIQVWYFFRSRPLPQVAFKTRYLYGVVRHPLMLGFLIAF